MILVIEVITVGSCVLTEVFSLQLYGDYLSACYRDGDETVSWQRGYNKSVWWICLCISNREASNCGRSPLHI